MGKAAGHENARCSGGGFSLGGKGTQAKPLNPEGTNRKPVRQQAAPSGTAWVLCGCLRLSGLLVHWLCGRCAEAAPYRALRFVEKFARFKSPCPGEIVTPDLLNEPRCLVELVQKLVDASPLARLDH